MSDEVSQEGDDDLPVAKEISGETEVINEHAIQDEEGMDQEEPETSSPVEIEWPPLEIDGKNKFIETGTAVEEDEENNMEINREIEIVDENANQDKEERGQEVVEPTHPKQMKCSVGDIEFLHGENIKGNPCKSCRCNHGKILCGTQKCPPPPNESCKIVGPHEGQCCPTFECEKPEPPSPPKIEGNNSHKKEVGEDYFIDDGTGASQTWIEYDDSYDSNNQEPVTPKYTVQPVPTFPYIPLIQ